MNISDLNIQLPEDYKRWTFNWYFYENFRAEVLLLAAAKEIENGQ